MANEPIFTLTPDAEGNLWAQSLPGVEPQWGVNLGPKQAAMEVMAELLAREYVE